MRTFLRRLRRLLADHDRVGRTLPASKGEAHLRPRLNVGPRKRRKRALQVATLHSDAASNEVAIDIEGSEPPRRKLHHEQEHGMHCAGARCRECRGFYQSDRDRQKNELEASAEEQESLIDQEKLARMEMKGKHKLAPEEVKLRRARLQRKEDAKIKILGAADFMEFKAIIEEDIEEIWLGGVEIIPGNIYRIAALGGSGHEGFVGKAARRVGAIATFAIQFLGPPAVYFSIQASALRISQGFEAEIDWFDFKGASASWEANGPVKLLSTLLIFAFCLNGLFVITDESIQWFHAHELYTYLKRKTQIFNGKGALELMLYVDAFMNVWVVLWCVRASVAQIGRARDPTEVLFDALGLLFIYRLDDIGGDFGFVDSKDWNGLRYGWIYDKMINPRPDDPEGTQLEEGEIGQNSTRVSRFVLRYVFGITRIIVLFFTVLNPLLAIFSDFTRPLEKEYLRNMTRPMMYDIIQDRFDYHLR